MRRHTFTEDFEYQGVFWLPDKPEKHVPGTVSYNDEGINLHLFGVLDKGDKFEESDHDPDFILGRLREGSLVTLYRTMATESSPPFGEFSEHTIPPWPHYSSYVVQHMFLEAHFKSKDEVRFTAVGASFTHLEEWMGAKGLPFEPGARNQRFLPTFTHPEPIRMRVDAIGSDVSTFWTRSSGPRGYTAIHLEHSVQIVVAPDEQKDLGWCLSTLRDCRNLLTLLVGRPVHPKRVTAWVEDSGLGVNAYGETQRESVEVFSLEHVNFARRDPPETFPLWSSHDVLVPLPSIEPNLDQVINAWFDKASLLRPVYTLYFSALYSKGMYLESEFLSLAQAVEVFHRSLYGGEDKYFSASEFREYRKDMLSVLQKRARAVFTDRLAFINDFTLKERLNDLSKRTPSSVRHLVVEDFDDFTTRVKDTRNLLTHYSSQKRAFTEEELIGANRRMRLWLMALLLLEIGIAEPTVIEAMQKYKRRNFPTALLPKNNDLNQGLDV